MEEKDPESEFDPPTETSSPNSPSEGDLLRQAYVEHGKRIGALEQRLEEIYTNIQGEVETIKDKLKKTRTELKELYEKIIQNPM